jgi:hypothetical protein
MRATFLWFSLLLGSPIFAQPLDHSTANLDGCWRNVRNQYLPCYIRQSGSYLVFTNEYGSQAEGRFISRWETTAYQWGNLRARIIDNGNRLIWDGNGEWVRDYSCRGE